MAALAVPPHSSGSPPGSEPGHLGPGCQLLLGLCPDLSGLWHSWRRQAVPESRPLESEQDPVAAAVPRSQWCVLIDPDFSGLWSPFLCPSGCLHCLSWKGRPPGRKPLTWLLSDITVDELKRFRVEMRDYFFLGQRLFKLSFDLQRWHPIWAPV